MPDTSTAQSEQPNKDRELKNRIIETAKHGIAVATICFLCIFVVGCFTRSSREASPPAQETTTVQLTGFERIKQSAENGDAEAQYQLGACYSRGEHVSQDVREAAKWYRKAADQGHSQARYNLSQLTKAGLKFPADD